MCPGIQAVQETSAVLGRNTANDLCAKWGVWVMFIIWVQKIKI